MKRINLIFRIRNKIKRSRKNTFVPGDFRSISMDRYDQSLRALRTMVRDGELIKLGQGIYAKAKKVDYGNIIPKGYIVDLARESLKKLGIKTFASDYENTYNSGKSTQVPTGRVIAVNRRVRRNIGFNGNLIKFQIAKR
ncbi:MAG: hypothetical protein LBD94_02695 [Rickettsiales bacterium]|nr:hypothetical protein [Rickettsiales bacterium]